MQTGRFECRKYFIILHRAEFVKPEDLSIMGVGNTECTRYGNYEKSVDLK